MTEVQKTIDYCNKVINEEVLACHYIKKACERFLSDMSDENSRWIFVNEYAEDVMEFARMCKYIDGSVAGQHVELSDWQRLYFSAAYGFVDRGDHEIRRYTRLVTMIGRKNAKSTLLAIHGLYELLFAPEGSQIYSLATTEKQATLVWAMADRMLTKLPPAIAAKVKKVSNTLSVESNWNRWQPLSRESKRLDGLNSRFNIIDEAAAIQNRDLIEVITSSMGSQKSPQTAFITTAQDLRDTYFYELLEHSQRVLDGHGKDDRLFALLYSLDNEEEWDDPDMLIKANPNLGSSVSREFLLDQLAEAKDMPNAKANFMIKYCNLFVSTTTVWIPRNRWDNNTVDKEPDLSKAPCFVGVDLANTEDLNAVCYLFDIGDKYYVKFQCYWPETTYNNTPKHLKQVYSEAKNSGMLNVMEGDIANHEIIMDDIKEAHRHYNIKDIAYDPWGSAQLIFAKMDAENYTTNRVGQSIGAVTGPAKELEQHILSGKIIHDGNNFISWQIGNTVVYTDVNGNIKPRKGEDAHNKVDATIAMMMALSAAIDNGGLKPTPKISIAFA